MGVVTVPKGARGFDALGEPADPARMVQDGWVFRTFYICQDSSITTKITNRTRGPGSRNALARIQRSLDAGMAVLLNYEWAADRWTKGYNTGVGDGIWSAQLCEELGYPHGLPVLVSFDTDVSAATLPTAVAYGDGFQSGLGTRWPIGAYAELSVIAGVRNVLGWQVMASFWNLAPFALDPVVHIRQRRPTSSEVQRYPYVGRPGAWAIDANDALRPFRAWGNGGEPIEQALTQRFSDPTPLVDDTGDDMEAMTIRASDHPEDAWFWWNGQRIGAVRSMTQVNVGHFAGLYKGASPDTNFTRDDIQKMIDSGWVGGPIPEGYTAPPV